MTLVRKHGLIRVLSLAVIGSSLTYVATRAGARVDLTAEGLSQITPGTRALIEGVNEERPVVVTAYVSKEVPRNFVATRSRLLNVLHEMQASAGPGLTVRIFEPEPFSEAAQEAQELYGIAPRSLYASEGGRVNAMPTFLGLAFTSGPREEVIPFLERGLSVEYELARALSMVVRDDRRTVGVLRTDAKIMGDFDLQARRQVPAWRIVGELRKQYEVRSLNPGAEIPEDVDVLVVPQVSSMTQEQLGFLQGYLDAGRPALLIADPMPVFDIRLSPREPMLPPPQQQGGFGQFGAQQGEPKGDYRALLASIGVEWHDERVVYDTENPNPRFDGVPPYIVFAGQRGESNTFDGQGPIVDGLEQVVTLFAGSLAAKEGADTSFEALVQTGSSTGSDAFNDMVDRSNPFFGMRGPVMPPRLGPKADTRQTMAARVTGGEKDYNVIVLADLDMIGDDFFVLRERGGDIDGDGLIDQRFDNVPFLLNCIDTLAGDDSFVALRKRQPKYRRLEKVDEYTREAREKREQEVIEANEEATKQLEEAQTALDAKVAEIEARTDIDDRTKKILSRSAQEAEQRRLDLRKQNIEREKQKKLDRIEAEHMRAVDEVRDRIRVASILLPPIPALFMGLFIFGRKRRREQSSIPESRKRKQASAPQAKADAVKAKES